MIRNVALKNALSNTVFRFFSLINKVIPKNQNEIMLYSNLGFRDNIQAIYEYLIDQGYNKKYHIVLSSKDAPETVPENVEAIGNL